MRFALFFFTLSVFAQPFVVSLRSLKEQHRPSNVEKTLQKASSAYHKGQLEKSRQLLDEALTSDPKSVRALTMAGALAVEMHQFPRAANLLDRAVEEDPTDPFVLSMSAATRGLIKDFEAAKNLALRSLRLDPLSARANFVLGMSLILLKKDYDEAERSLRRATDRFKEANLYLSYLRLIRGDAVGASEYCREFFHQPEVTGDACLKQISDDAAAESIE